MDFNIKDQVAVVTGGGNGIGVAIAHSFAAEGCKVAVLDRDIAGATRVATEIMGQGGQAQAFEVDVTSPKSVEVAIQAVQEKLSGLHILVNNAGFSEDGPVHEMTDEQWLRVIDVNLNGAFYCIRAAVPAMLAQSYGRIINVASRAYLGDVYKANYSAAKAGMLGLTKALSLELAPSGITVNALAPGLVETERVRNLPYWRDIEARCRATMPVKRSAAAEEIAQAVIFLAGQTSGFITGEVLHITGGRYG